MTNFSASFKGFFSEAPFFGNFSEGVSPDAPNFSFRRLRRAAIRSGKISVNDDAFAGWEKKSEQNPHCQGHSSANGHSVGKRLKFLESGEATIVQD